MIYVKRNGVTVNELLTITASDQRRDPFERTTHSETTDAKQMSIVDRGFLSFEINYIAIDPTHQGLIDSLAGLSEDIFTFDDGNGEVTSYGMVQSFKYQSSPVDALMRVRVDVLLIAEPPNLLLQESGSELLTEAFEDLELDL